MPIPCAIFYDGDSLLTNARPLVISSKKDSWRWRTTATWSTRAACGGTENGGAFQTTIDTEGSRADCCYSADGIIDAVTRTMEASKAACAGDHDGDRDWCARP